jgi:hypothetical protein
MTMTRTLRKLVCEVVPSWWQRTLKVNGLTGMRAAFLWVRGEVGGVVTIEIARVSVERLVALGVNSVVRPAGEIERRADQPASSAFGMSPARCAAVIASSSNGSLRALPPRPSISQAVCGCG